MDICSISGESIQFECKFDFRPRYYIGNLGLGSDVRKLDQSFRRNPERAVSITWRCFRMYHNGITY